MKHHQESQIEFRREDVKGEYPHSRGLIVHQYGSDLEECIEKARKEFNLDKSWKVVASEDAR